MTDGVAMPAAFVIRPMTADDANAVAAWHYDEPYSFYGWDRDPVDLAELLDPSQWGRRYFSADDADGELAGFFVIKPAGSVTEIGLGLRPALTGRGLGGAFPESGLRFAAERFGARNFALAVAAFNHRAITVYERVGFREVCRYEHATSGAVHEFVWMTRT